MKVPGSSAHRSVPPARGTTSRPFVFINMAMTADGKIATANRAISSFGGKRDLEHLYELRATADAVMNGARTVEASAVSMGPGGKRFREIRLRNNLPEYNLRIIVSGSGSIDLNSVVFKHRFSPIIVLTTGRVPAPKLRRLRALADDVFVGGKTEIDFVTALQWLRRKWNVRRLLCEGGAELNAALIRGGLVDEIHLTVCPKIVGGALAPTMADGKGFSRLADAAQFELSASQRIGDELFLVYRARKTRR